MALLKVAANSADNSQTLDDRSALPAGNYLAHIVKSEMKATKAGTGHYLSLHFKVLEGECAGRMIFANLNLDNPNSTAVEIATKELNSICNACDMQDVTDSEDLHQIPMVLTVKVDPATAQWPEGNSITAYAPESEWDGEEAVTEEATGEEATKPWE